LRGTLALPDVPAVRMERAAQTTEEVFPSLALFATMGNWQRAAFERCLASELWQARRQIRHKPSRYF
jgi:hypothetical protein